MVIPPSASVNAKPEPVALMWIVTPRSFRYAVAEGPPPAAAPAVMAVYVPRMSEGFFQIADVARCSVAGDRDIANR
jgi:hypothetical protein